MNQRQTVFCLSELATATYTTRTIIRLQSALYAIILPLDFFRVVRFPLMKNILEAWMSRKPIGLGKLKLLLFEAFQSECGKESSSQLWAVRLRQVTLLHILGGLVKPTSGRVVIDNEEISSREGRRSHRHSQAKNWVCLSEVHLLPTLTAAGNLEIARQILVTKPRRTSLPECSQTAGP